MRDKVMQSLKIGRLIAKNLILIFALAVMCFMGMFSWFTQSTKSKADGISVVCEAPDGVEIAIVEHDADPPAEDDYQIGTIELTSANYPFLSDLSLTEITSDGKTFLKPMLIQSSGVAHPDEGVEWENAEANLHYLSFDLYIRCKSQRGIVLDSGSNFSTVSNTLVGSNAGNKSNSGEFSKDCIVGATRFSVLPSGENKDEILVWLPRPDIQFDSNTVNVGSVSDESQKHYYYKYDSDTQKYTKTEKDVTVSTKGTNDSSYHLPNDVEILRLSGNAENGYYTDHVVCNMWIDGEDAEARLALVGGKFTIDLKLALMPEDNNS